MPKQRVKTSLSRRDIRNSSVEDAAHPPPPEPSLVTCRCDHTPTGPCRVRREGKREQSRRRASRSPSLAGAVPFLLSLPITFPHGKQQEFLPSPLEDEYNGHTNDELSLSTLLPGSHAHV
jgi:hypothetical protein